MGRWKRGIIILPGVEPGSKGGKQKSPVGLEWRKDMAMISMLPALSSRVHLPVGHIVSAVLFLGPLRIANFSYNAL